MSYFGSAEVTNAAAVGSIVVEPQTGDGSTESAEAIDLAKKVATEIAASGVVGAGPFSVMISGHSNPEHTPAPGVSVDTLNVTIRALPVA